MESVEEDATSVNFSTEDLNKSPNKEHEAQTSRESEENETTEDLTSEQNQVQEQNLLDQIKLKKTHNDIKTTIFTKRKLFMISISIIFYITDIVSDHILAVKYAIGKNWWYCVFTLSCVLLPSLAITRKGFELRAAKMTGFLDYVFLPFNLLFNFEPVIHYYLCWSSVHKYLNTKDTNEKVQIHEEYVRNYHNVAKLKYWEGMMEAVPQLALQLFIILTSLNENLLDFDLTFCLQIGAIFASLVGLLLTFFNRYNSWIEKSSNHATTLGYIVDCLERFLPLVSRIFCIAAFSVVHPVYALLTIAVHWLAITVWIYKTRENLTVVWVMVTGILYTLVSRYDNITNLIIAHLIFLTENIIFISLWAYITVLTINIKIIVLSIFISIDILFRILSVYHYKNDSYKFQYKLKDDSPAINNDTA